MDLALNKLQRLICHKTKQTNQPSKKFAYESLILSDKYNPDYLYENNANKADGNATKCR